MFKPTITLTSFGYANLNGDPPPSSDRIEDVRQRFRDPARAKNSGILDLDGTNRVVQYIVLSTPGVTAFLNDIVADVRKEDGPRSIAIGCVGGKHPACALVERLQELLTDDGYPVVKTHLHAHLPRILAHS